MQRGLVGSEMCIRDRVSTQSTWDRTLTSLYIHSNNIGVAGAKSIASALKSNVSLTTLYLWNNNIGDTGTESIAGALTTNSTLTELSLGSNKIGDIGAKFLADALISNYTLQDLYLSCSNTVSYTHLTLPTILLVQISVVAVSLKKKKYKEKQGKTVYTHRLIEQGIIDKHEQASNM
eukprot:TRINITY_DN17103_c0_g1_i1.p1 TRINITY_DN17103_c0_g1~~TRINITY_DN17103_c0_g1_i1.p1  ORF type:complete len:177 (+),score=37.20 TRINITY_DN17103_c0_g1_i1:172-702(+)